MTECYQVYGYNGCAFFERAKCWANSLDSGKFKVKVSGTSRPQYQQKLASLKQDHASVDKHHRTSPIVLSGCGEEPVYVGGSDSFVSQLKQKGIRTDDCW